MRRNRLWYFLAGCIVVVLGLCSRRYAGLLPEVLARYSGDTLYATMVFIGLGFLFYVKDTSLPDIWAARLRPLYQASYNKYWVDEFFGWAVTRRVMDAARGVFAFDSKVVDGGVNGSAWLTRFSSRVTGLTDQYFVDGVVNAVAAFVMRLMSPLFRAAQTGFTQNYAFVMVLGLVAALGMIFGADILGWFKR